MGADNSKVVLEAAESLGQPTVNELVGYLTKHCGLKFNDAAREVYVQYKRGGLNLQDANPSSGFGSYLFNVENAWFWGVSVLVAVSFAVVFLVNASVLLYVRYVLGGVFVLFLPGYLLISALYPRSGELDGLERVALSVGLSLAVVPLVGLVLNYTPWGIRLEPIMVALAALCLALAVVCVVRRFRYYQLSLK